MRQAPRALVRRVGELERRRTQLTELTPADVASLRASARAKLAAVIERALERERRGESPPSQRPAPVYEPGSPKARLFKLIASRLDLTMGPEGACDA